MLRVSNKSEPDQRDELEEQELDGQDGEPLPDREAMSVINPPFVSPPGVTLPVDPPH